MSWDQTVAALLGGAWRANAYNPATYERKWALNQQYRAVASARPRAMTNQPGINPPGIKWPAPAKPPRATAGFPQRIDIGMPWSSREQEPIPVASGLTPIGGIGQTLGNIPSYLNLANVIPWTMERPFVGVKEVATQLTGDDENVVNQGVDALSGALIAAAQPVAEVVDAPMNFVRDQLIAGRARTYRALVRGDVPTRRPDPRGITSYDRVLYQLAQADDGEDRARLERAAMVLADALDLPPELKREIRANPDISDEQIDRLFDKYGRQVSYTGDAGAAFASLGLYGGGYIAETIATLGVGGIGVGAARGIALGARGAAQVPLAFGGLAPKASKLAKLAALPREAGFALRSVPYATPMQNALRFGAWAGRGWLQVQKYTMAAGLGMLGADLFAEAVFRTMGNEEGVAYLDKLNRSVLFSDDPAVQLVTSFSVEPIAALKIARNGYIGFAKKTLGTIPVGKKAGSRYATLWDDDEFLNRSLAKAFGVDPDVAPNLIGDMGYESKAQAWDALLNLGGDAATAADSPVRIVGAAGWATAVSNLDSTRAFFSSNFDQVLDIIEKYPEQLHARVLRDWTEFRYMYGPYNPWIAVKIHRNWMKGAEATLDTRALVDGVQGLPDVFPPVAQEAARDYVERLFSAGQKVTAEDVQEFLYRFPGARGQRVGREIRPYWYDLPKAAKLDDPVERSLFDTIIERASLAYDDMLKRNPVKARTGADPILRPDSPTRTRDFADALGTTEDAMAAVIDKTPAAWKGADRDLVRAFARDRMGLSDDQLRAMPDDEVWTKANEHVEVTTKEWVQRGAQVDTAHRALASLDAEERAIRSGHEYTTGAGRLRNRMDAEGLIRLDEIRLKRAQLRNLISDATEPVTLFAEAVKFARPGARHRRLVERAELILSAQERLARVSAVIETAESFDWPSVPKREVVAPSAARAAKLGKPARTTKGGKDVYLAERPEGVLSLLSQVGGMYVWNGGRPLVPNSILTRYNRFMMDHGLPSRLSYEPGVTVPEMWSRLGRGLRETPALGEALTLGQRNMILRNLGGDNLDEWAGAWSKAANDGDFLEWLTALRKEFDDALAGERLYDVASTAGTAAEVSVPGWAMAEAKAAAQQMWSDPLSEAEQALARGKIVRELADDQGELVVTERLIREDPELLAQAEQMANRAGASLSDYIHDPANRGALRGLVSEEAGAIPGVPVAQTELDQAIINAVPGALEDLKVQLADLQGRIVAPIRNVSPEAADLLIRTGRPSRQVAREVDQAGLSWSDRIADGSWVERGVASRGAAVLYRGNFEMPPRTIGGLIRVLRTIENGNAANLGMGSELIAEVQRGIRDIIRHEVSAARRAGFEAGFLGMGKGLNPSTWTQDAYESISELFGKEGKGGAIAFDDAGEIVYTLKKRPKEAVALEMSTVPGMAEELLSGVRPQTFEQRLGTAHVRQVFNYLFGPLHNQEVFFEAAQRFSQRLLGVGVPEPVSRAIWKEWGEIAKRSRDPVRRVGAEGQISFLPGMYALYASPKNIPDGMLAEAAQAVLREKMGTYAGGLEDEVVEAFRISTSTVRRAMADQFPIMGDFLQNAYGKFAHNSWITTKYYQFRFTLDARFHAMNAGEGFFLYAGRAGLRPSEVREGMFGMDMASIARVADDAMLNTGYPFSVTRDGRIYQTLVKEQPDALRTLVIEDPDLFEKAIRQIAEHDPELSRTIPVMGDTVDSWLGALHVQWKKMMSSADPASVVDDALMRDLAGSPELAEVYSRISKVNHDLLDDIRGTFYGNPSRSRVERALNHYLLYWPISYQIKATKWMLRIMFDRAGGLKTNALGAYALDALATQHMQLMENDPEYARVFEEHPTLVFAAQMLLPITPTSMGISLSPPIRDILGLGAEYLPFLSETDKQIWGGYAKNIFEVGPVYTLTTLLPRLVGELYSDLQDVPLAEIPLRMLGKKPKKKAPEEDLWQPEPFRWGQ